MDTSEQSRLWAKSFAKTAKPLFIGSIPIAASNLFNNLETFTSSVKSSL
jgi:hypothetical protein